MHTKNSISRYSDGMAGDVRPAAVVSISKFIIKNFARTGDRTPKRI
jgi:hypothetical protein